MDRETYKVHEEYMLLQMNDSSHDRQHIYRVLYLALDIARCENNVDMDVLIASCLLHDIGRQRQFESPALCHASEGGAMAYDYLMRRGWSSEKANHVKKCVESHRYRTDNLPESIEAKILFDADKIDATGAMGIARTILYTGQMNTPLYLTDENGRVTDGADETAGLSFLHEYNFKLKNLYDRFFTRRGNEIASQRRAAAVNFYSNMLDEVKSTHEQGIKYLDAVLS
ncbi:MAG: HD domain-containing protein [Oscillospiraceae bacterium]|nr:HD domain-containing protein [Oscillospiraceae bacterium]